MYVPPLLFVMKSDWGTAGRQEVKRFASHRQMRGVKDTQEP